jgi:hypothetical protein
MIHELKSPDVGEPDTHLLDPDPVVLTPVYAEFLGVVKFLGPGQASSASEAIRPKRSHS